jgi:hypothetical protein
VITAISRHPAAPARPTGHASPRASANLGALGAAAATRNLAASWIAREVSRDAILSCDPLMCLTLRDHGIPAGDLLVLRPGMTDPLGSELVVATPAIRSQFGSMLSVVYAPAVIASFGTGNGSIAVRAIAPGGARAYEAALSADVRARTAAGDQLRRNKRITLGALAAGQLAAGQVDSRLLGVLVTMAALDPVHVVAFGDSGPGASLGVPLRCAYLAAVGRPTWSGQSAYARSVLAFFHAQLPPYLAANIGPVPADGGQTVLRIEYAAPSPLGLLGHQSR